MTIDTHRLETASRCVLLQLKANPLIGVDMTEINAVVEAYGGPFLDGCDDEWVLQERERLHCLFVRSTFELMRSAAIQHRYERALDFGRRILATDPLRESVQRDVMLLLVLNGQPAEAVRSYKKLVALLKTELNIGPMPETERLYGQILSGE